MNAFQKVNILKLYLSVNFQSMIKSPPFAIYNEANGQICRNNADIDLQELQIELTKMSTLTQ